MSMKNIGGSDDAFFRYKMPDIEVKIEGRGNGIKTVIPNMADIGLALKRDPQYPTKFFAIELGALSQWDKERNVGIVNGAHDHSVLSSLLDDFIKRYVLCANCNNPETELKVKDRKIMAKCLACGHRGPSDNIHKLSTFIVNHPPPKKEKKSKKDKPDKSEKSEKGGKRKSRKGKDKEDRNSKDGSGGDDDGDNNDGDDDEDDEGEEQGMNFEVTEEMEKMHIDKSAELDDPVEVVETLLSTVADKSTDERLAAIKAHQEEHQFDDAQMFQYVFKALVKSGMGREVKTNIDLFTKMLGAEPDKDTQWLILSLVEERCESFPEAAEGVAACLMALYEADLLDEDLILVWHEKGVSSLVALADQAASKASRKAASKFVEWLKNAEEEDSEDGE